MKILFYVFIIILICVLSYCIHNKVRFHFRTFLHRGFKKFDDDYGLYCFYSDQRSVVKHFQ